jgi:hypothetical protein
MGTHEHVDIGHAAIGHPHEHDHAAVEPELPPSGEGTVVLDIGGDRGAAIIFTPGELSGQEIEIRPLDQPWDGTHTAIRPRELPDTVAHAGVFGSLRAGPYQLRIRRGDPVRFGSDPVRSNSEPVVDLVVIGGEVAQLEWPAAVGRPRE